MKIYHLILSTVVALSACKSRNGSGKIEVTGHAQGTTYQVLYLSNDGINYQRSIDSLLIEIDNSLSTYNKKSLISKFNDSVSSLKVDSMFLNVFTESKKIFNETNGAFNPAIAPVVNAWGFGFKNLEKTDSTSIDSLMKFVDFSSITDSNQTVVKKNKYQQLDFNAIAQGYSVDVLCEFLESNNVFNYMVEIGGEVKAKGRNDRGEAWRIGIDKSIENNKTRELQAIINLKNKALATSGNYRKFYEKNGVKYSHTISPYTGYPVNHSLLSATVVSETASEADAYATAFMVLGKEKTLDFLENHQNIDVLLVYSNEAGEIETFVSKGLTKFIELIDKNE